MEAGLIPKYHDLSDDEYGNKIVSEIDPDTLIISTRKWEMLGFHSLGRKADNVSICGADLSEDGQAPKLR
jgi:hypothetical protein